MAGSKGAVFLYAIAFTSTQDRLPNMYYFRKKIKIGEDEIIKKFISDYWGKENSLIKSCGKSSSKAKQIVSEIMIKHSIKIHDVKSIKIRAVKRERIIEQT